MRLLSLIVGGVCTLLGGLSVHVVLQQTLHVPFPSQYPAHSIVEQFDQATTVFGLLLFVSWAAGPLSRFPLLGRWAIVFAVYVMLRESFRAALMEGVVTTSYAYPVLELIPKLFATSILTFLCVVAQPAVPRIWQKIVVSGVIYVFVSSTMAFATGQFFEPLLAHFAYLRHDEVYAMPYGENVLIPAYITYVEPVAGCIIAAALVWQRLAGRPPGAIVWFTFLILLLRRSLFPPFIYMFYESHQRLTAFLSAGQFSLETIALALLAATTWRVGATSSK
jgi:hypothetical protein